jgi:hypothetical protein
VVNEVQLKINVRAKFFYPNSFTRYCRSYSK